MRRLPAPAFSARHRRGDSPASLGPRRRWPGASPWASIHMLQDETCFFLAADFDKTHWREDVRGVLGNLPRLHLPAAVERSRSGNGGHVWLFFAEAIPAALARKLGSHILTETMERRPETRPGFLRPVLSQSRHVAARRFRQSDCVAAAKRAAPARQQRFFDRAMDAPSRSMGVSLDRSENRTDRRRGDRPRRRGEGASGRRACCLGGRGRRLALAVAAVAASEGTADCRTVAQERSNWFSAIRSTLPRSVAAGAAKSADSACGIPESGVLQGAGDAFADLRQAAHHRLRRRPCDGHHRFAAWLFGGRAAASLRICTSRRTCETNGMRASPCWT